MARAERAPAPPARCVDGRPDDRSARPGTAGHRAGRGAGRAAADRRRWHPGHRSGAGRSGQSRVPLVGRTTTICTVAPPAEGDSSTTEVAAVATRQAPGREGQLTGDPAGRRRGARLTITEQGKGETADRRRPAGRGGRRGRDGHRRQRAMLSSAPTGRRRRADGGAVPGARHQRTGSAASAATDDDRTELVLTNADDAQAQVDLRFYGRNGRVVVPGSPGLVVEARSTRTVSLTSLVRTEGPLGLSRCRPARAGWPPSPSGSRSDGRTPIGADWQVPASAPATTVVIPGVPEGAGARQLVVTNPNRGAGHRPGPGARPAGPVRADRGRDRRAGAGEHRDGRPGDRAGRRGRRRQADQRPAGDRRGDLDQRARAAPAGPGRPVRSRAAGPDRGERAGHDPDSGGQRADPEQQRDRGRPGLVRGAELRGRDPAHRRRAARSGRHRDPAAQLAGTVVRGGPGAGRVRRWSAASC